MHQKLRDTIDISIVLGTIDADREVLIKKAGEDMLKAKSKEEAFSCIDEAIRLKDERSDVVREWIEIEMLDRAKN